MTLEGQGQGLGQRLDKWLWQARFFKSRALASKFCTNGKVRIDGERVNKASRLVRVGQVLTFAYAGHIRVVRVLGFGDRRGPADEARLLYQDMTLKREDEDPCSPD